ncbi:PREDICTED: uncharacterized protein LOC109231545 [Nicotiana attenuata]|uniref:uncharacterized protein LOC109231545 n=1 Tax=Nicotiana attenuata TaxID=49451 RepID=UPI0009052A3F|nr:PREDICTED: uncharacterized protein LOC109231545 [Nicotiana attenuata]
MFEKYDGHEDPIAHLKSYCNQLRGTGGKEELLIAYFGESLVGIASEWNSLSNLKKKSSERFREYAVKWREQAARVKPPMDETQMIGEMVENGLKIGRILSQSAIRDTPQAIQGGSRGVANRKKKEEVAMATSGPTNPRPPRPYFATRTPQHYYSHKDVAYARPQQQFNQNRAPFPRNQPPRQAQYNPQPPQNNFSYNARAQEPPRIANFTPIGHDTEDCWTLKRALENLTEQKRIVLKDEEVPNVTNNPLPSHNNGLVIGMNCEDKKFDPALKAIIAIADVEKKPKAIAKRDRGEKKSKPTPQNAEKALEKKLGQKEQKTLSPPRRFEMNKGPKMYVPKGTYVVWGPVISPRLNEPVVNGHAPQRPMTDPTAVLWNYNKAVLTYKGKEVLGEANETKPTEKYLNLEELNKSKKKRFPIKKPVSAEEAEEFFRKMKAADYEVIDQIRESPSQVSLLSLLVCSAEHQKVLIKTLNEAYVPIETTVEQLERMAERFFAVN